MWVGDTARGENEACSQQERQAHQPVCILKRIECYF